GRRPRLPRREVDLPQMTLDHVGIVVESIDAVLPFYRDQLGLVVAHREEVASQKVKVAFLKDAGDDRAQVELLEPMGDDGAVAKFLKNRGPGTHHVAFHSADIAGAM